MSTKPQALKIESTLETTETTTTTTRHSKDSHLKNKQPKSPLKNKEEINTRTQTCQRLYSKILTYAFNTEEEEEEQQQQ